MMKAVPDTTEHLFSCPVIEPGKIPFYPEKKVTLKGLGSDPDCRSVLRVFDESILSGFGIIIIIFFSRNPGRREEDTDKHQIS